MSRESSARIVVLTKTPVPGLVKTRLARDLGAVLATRIHLEMATATLALARATGLPVDVRLAGPMDHPWVDGLRAQGHRVLPQCEGNLGARLIEALAGPGFRIALGTDCPTFEPAWLHRATNATQPVCFGPSTDGGYWTVAVDGPMPDLFNDIDWSTERVLQQSLARADRQGWAVKLLPTCYDIDEVSDLPRLAADPRCPPPLLELLSGVL
jgi:rSAM/selenodomain-associated transferase 1